MPPIYINGQQVQKRYIGIQQVVSAYVGSQKVFGGFDPASLFAAGEQGAWYDPSDLTTMFQDSAGTTPVTVDGQPVGLILDKSKQLVTGSNTCPAFAAATWNVIGALPSGWVMSGGILTVTAGAQWSQASTTLTGNALGKWFKATIDVASISGTIIAKPWRGWYNNYVFESDISTPGLKTIYFYSDNATAGFEFQSRSAGLSCVINSITIQEVAGNHARQATAAARPLYKTDGTYSWLQFDGVDDSLSTGNINFTSTDKMSVFVGVYKNTNSVGIVSELSANGAANQGAFYIVSGTDNGAEYTFAANGSAFSIAKVFAYVAPDTAVLACISNIPADLNQISRNTVAGQSGTSDLGAVNFGNYPLYIGRRAGSSLPLNGKIYSIIVRGALSTPQEITDTETWVNSKTGAY